MRLKSYYPVDISVDGEEMRIRVKRLNFAEGSDLRARVRETKGNDDSASEALVADTIKKYVTVETDVVLELANDQSLKVVTGEDILVAFGGRSAILGACYIAVLRQNSLTEEEKKALRSPTDSSAPSNGPNQEAVGPKQETIATSAVN